MKYNINDIATVSRFSDALKATCDDIKNGKPKSRACADHNISLAMFNKIMTGLKKSNESKSIAPERNNSYKPWQDRLIADLGGTEDTYIPDDFETELDKLESVHLTEDESALIDIYYRGNHTITQAARTLGIAESTASTRLHTAQRKLRKHRDELFHGAQYTKRLEQLSTLRSTHTRQLKWITTAIDYLKSIDNDSEVKIETTPISDEAKAFFRQNNFVTIGNVMNVPLKELFVKITDMYDDEGAFLTISPEHGISPETSLKDIGLPSRTVKALAWKDLNTVSDVLSLTASDAAHIPHVSAEQIIYIYRLVLFGEP